MTARRALISGASIVGPVLAFWLSEGRLGRHRRRASTQHWELRSHRPRRRRRLRAGVPVGTGLDELRWK